MAAPFRVRRTRWGAATRGLAASSVATAASGDERSVVRSSTHCESGVPGPASAIPTKGDR
jgi:hypothetical protein